MLALTSSGVALSLAGCTGGSDDEPEPTGGSDDSDAGDDDATGSDDADGSDSDPEQVNVAIGDLVDGDQLHLVVEGVERTDSLGQFSEPEPGNEFAVVSLALKNVSDEYLNVSNLLQTRLRDDEDFQYDQAFVSGGGNTFNDGQFAPGEVERGTITFEIPDDASGLELTFDLDVSIFGGIDRATIDLESEADSITELVQELGIEVYDVGQEISFQDVAVSVNDTRTASELGQFSEADDGNEYMIVDISITNDTGEEQRFSTILQMMLKDGEGFTYQEDISGMSSLDQGFDEGTPLSDGETRRGELAYELAEGVAPLYWVFEFALFESGDKTFWEIRS